MASQRAYSYTKSFIQNTNITVPEHFRLKVDHRVHSSCEDEKLYATTEKFTKPKHCSLFKVEGTYLQDDVERMLFNDLFYYSDN